MGYLIEHQSNSDREIQGMQVTVKGATHTGRRRRINEDSHAWWIPAGAEERNRLGALLVVADGMGGANAGEEASFLAVQTVVDHYRCGTGTNPREELKSAVETANKVIYEKASHCEAQSGMGTTCSAAVVLKQDLLIAHVGDSRIYKINKGGIILLTRDHSLVADMVDRGELAIEQQRNHPRRNVVTRAVGIRESVEVDDERKNEFLVDGDILLLCSDGLHGVVTETEIWDIIQATPPENACPALITAANNNGGPDNITAVMAWITSDA
jgi:PPM family protein phosphatase